jgi:hypothetical protein
MNSCAALTQQQLLLHTVGVDAAAAAAAAAVSGGRVLGHWKRSSDELSSMSALE